MKTAAAAQSHRSVCSPAAPGDYVAAHFPFSLPLLLPTPTAAASTGTTLVETETETETEVEEKIKEAFDKGWAIIVWNDPVNLMSYVAHVFQIVLKMTKEVANRHMLEVHNNGKSVVGIETREQAEFLVHRLQSYGLQATMEVM